MDRLHATWLKMRGGVDYGRFRKALGSLSLFPASGPVYTDEQLDAALVVAVEVTRNDPESFAWRNFTPETWLAGIVEWVRLGAMPNVDPVTCELTERGERATRPVRGRVSA